MPAPVASTANVLGLIPSLPYLSIFKLSLHHRKKYGLKTFTSILLIPFYLFGTLVLPLGDFSHIKDLPAMFKHCKATEDKDLNAVEFLFEHVSGLGQLIEETEHAFEAEEEDGDKPHAPVQFNFEQQQQIICFYHSIKVPAIKPMPVLLLNTMPTHKVYICDYISKIFRPPIA